MRTHRPAKPVRSKLPVLLMLLLSVNAYARPDDPELEALTLADNMQKKPEKASDWRAFAEVASGYSRLRDGGDENSQRLSVDVQFDKTLTPAWRLFFSDRVDISLPATSNGDRAINTLKEAGVSWKPAENTLLDAGRINARYGIALGYNPTDFFKSYAVRSAVSVDPASLRENRQGSVMLRAQQLWDSGSLTLIASPRLADLQMQSGWNPNIGATNHNDRYLLAVSQKVGDFTPQGIIFQEKGQKPRFGLNLSHLLNDATVFNLEWSGGYAPKQTDAAFAAYNPAFHTGEQQWQQQIASGISYTTSNKLTLTAEAHYNSAAPDNQTWQQLQTGPLPSYLLYRAYSQQTQNLTTRRQLFLHATWQDAIIPHLDLSTMITHIPEDRSRRYWVEARFNKAQWEIALQVQLNQGSKYSVFGAATTKNDIQLLYRRFM
ncbi:hypothetical protein [Undibacterium squillarum]|uniref:Uncharacterized protein n=1 Tax=Undibacterium squillarum TaxID=1131567 RepID=A0ABQ2XVD7_9BURK|nr:hypothetical protein [Undibacterium squillarum]GGX34473.1 hypothetical protein GCM10010946_09600 [Undibacterium squillarum]